MDPTLHLIFAPTPACPYKNAVPPAPYLEESQKCTESVRCYQLLLFSPSPTRTKKKIHRLQNGARAKLNPTIDCPPTPSSCKRAAARYRLTVSVSQPPARMLQHLQPNRHQHRSTPCAFPSPRPPHPSFSVLVLPTKNGKEPPRQGFLKNCQRARLFDKGGTDKSLSLTLIAPCATTTYCCGPSLAREIRRADFAASFLTPPSSPSIEPTAILCLYLRGIYVQQTW